MAEAKRLKMEGDWPGHGEELHRALEAGLAGLSQERRESLLEGTGREMDEIGRYLERLRFAGYRPPSEEAEFMVARVSRVLDLIQDRSHHGG